MTRYRTVIAAVAILTFAVAACGSGGSAAAPPATAAPAAPAATGSATRTAAPTPVATTDPGATTSGPAAPAASTGGTAADPATTGQDICNLITEQEASAFLGVDPGVGVVTTTGSATACAYGGSLVVSVETGDGKAQFEGKQRALAGQPNAQTLTGLGDSAFAFIVANTIADMEILKGSTLLSVMVQGDPTRQNITVDALQKLGATTVGRL